MCGICGVVDLTGRPVMRSMVAAMLGMIGHRGPDDQGVYARGCCALGHARLSIIDLAGGHQPMYNSDGNLCITFNGEIFNYVELREELIAKGRVFATTSDTEVLLQLYEEEGDDFVLRLNGQWAFAIWNAREGKLFLSRDRLGVRPLFYTQVAGQFVFASEVKSVMAHPAVPRRLDLRGLSQTFRFWHTVAPRTAFEGIRELPPGCSINVAHGKVAVKKYWELAFDGEEHGNAKTSADDYVEQLQELLVEAIRVRLRADVPVGAYLSGGLDSSLITAIVSRFSEARLSTFSLCFDDPEFDETSFQRRLVAHLETDHHEVRCTNADVGRVFPEVVWHAEKPLLRTSPAPMYLLAKLVRSSGYKVVLTGEGSDEFFAGYDIFKEAKIRSFCAAQPHSVMRPLLFNRLYPYMESLQRQPEAFRRQFFRVRPEDIGSPFFSHLPRWETTGRLELFFSAEVKSALQGYCPEDEIEAGLPQAYEQWNSIKRAQYLEAGHLLPGYILSSQGDRVGMAHAIEGRFPFLDHRVVAFAASLPMQMKLPGLKEKHIVKLLGAKLLPKEIVARPKQPYRAPDAAAFFDANRKRFRNEYVEEALSVSSIQRNGIFDASAVSKLVSKLRNGQALGTRDGMALVGIISTQLLVQQFINGFNVRRHHEPSSAEVACVYQ